MYQSNQWVVRANMTDCKRKLETESDPDKHRILQELIDKEEAKLAMERPGKS